ncbi:hypothetical protein SAMN04487948_105366 [Halogranum amylolyticum]|uniref:Uncharacterized protein n=1 Tax=Halogranum amylolyticum TaxID=660520 RepID=A0A1H8SXB5_9EURY|nr:hypothetical protein [Halogranum amylolyticum]SEO82988.1 hypothetical protein SAMN04487948_105366 [Halogranum amylolyticum]
MHRRTLLASGAVLTLSGLAGCLGFGAETAVGTLPTASLRMEPVSDATIATRRTYGRGVDEESPEYDLVRAAVDDGPTRVDDTEPPFPADRPFVFEDGVYELSVDVVDSRPATTFFVVLDPAEGDVADEESVAYADLPEVDRAVFERRGWDDPGFLGFGTSVRYLDAHVPDSALVPDPAYSVVVWDAETRGEFSVDGSRETPLRTYEYTASVVADSAATLGRELRERYEFTLSGLSAAEREIVAEAVDGDDGYVVPADHPLPDAMRRLGSRFRSRDDVEYAGSETGDDPPSVDGTYLVRYDEEVYWTRIHVTRPSTATEASPS